MPILEKFFIAIGEVALSIIDHLKNLSFKNIEIKRNERNTEMDSAIFERLNLDVDMKMPSQEDRFDNLRNALLPYLLTKTSIGIVLLMLILSLLFSSLEITSMILVVVVMIYIFILYYPKIKEQKSYVKKIYDDILIQLGLLRKRGRPKKK